MRIFIVSKADNFVTNSNVCQTKNTWALFASKIELARNLGSITNFWFVKANAVVCWTLNCKTILVYNMCFNRSRNYSVLSLRNEITCIFLVNITNVLCLYLLFFLTKTFCYKVSKITTERGTYKPAPISKIFFSGSYHN